MLLDWSANVLSLKTMTLTLLHSANHCRWEPALFTRTSLLIVKSHWWSWQKRECSLKTSARQKHYLHPPDSPQTPFKIWRKYVWHNNDITSAYLRVKALQKPIIKRSVISTFQLETIVGERMILVAFTIRFEVNVHGTQFLFYIFKHSSTIYFIGFQALYRLESTLISQLCRVKKSTFRVPAFKMI